MDIKLLVSKCVELTSLTRQQINNLFSHNITLYYIYGRTTASRGVRHGYVIEFFSKRVSIPSLTRAGFCNGAKKDDIFNRRLVTHLVRIINTSCTALDLRRIM